MHFLLYVCVPADEAKTSLQARRRAWSYLQEEHFMCSARFCGHSDYFLIGGRYSGMLSLLRLKQADPPRFEGFLKKYKKIDDPKRALALFKRTYPDYDGLPPICRDNHSIDGATDDAQLMDKTLFSELKRGFSEYVKCTIAFEKPNVIFTFLDESEWPKNAADAVDDPQWVVVVDYHD